MKNDLIHWYHFDFIFWIMRFQTSILDWMGWPASHIGPQRYAAFVIFSLLHMATTTYSTRMHNIHWNASNPVFRIDRTDNVIDINGGNHPWEYDQVNIVCPVYKPGITEAAQEQYIIYSVTKQEYDSCRITQPSPKIIAVCNRPHELMYFTITFRSFTPTPGGLEFRPGHSYYFISTSSKNDLHRRVGGGCSTHNMKITFRVAGDNTIPSRVNEEVSEVNLQPPSLVSSPSEVGDLLPKETFYYPTSEVEKAGFYHHKQSHQEAQAPWLQSASTSTLVTTPASVQFLIAISVFYHWAVNFLMWDGYPRAGASTSWIRCVRPNPSTLREEYSKPSNI